jgi:hypothetical protein
MADLKTLTIISSTKVYTGKHHAGGTRQPDATGVTPADGGGGMQSPGDDRLATARSLNTLRGDVTFGLDGRGVAVFG